MLHYIVNLAGNYSAYGFEILLSRSLGPFILSVYLPSAMFVMMSWVSFFVPPVNIFLIRWRPLLGCSACLRGFLGGTVGAV